MPSILFAAVIIVLLLRPDGLFTRGGASVERL
jgi:branched-subunit amino acid ABC-type transport system permease component